jgi:hypothetical protein
MEEEMAKRATGFCQERTGPASSDEVLRGQGLVADLGADGRVCVGDAETVLIEFQPECTFSSFVAER